MLYAIGAGPRVVGVSSYDSFPPEVKKLPERRRPPRSERRADPVAEAADGSGLRQSDGSEAAARARGNRRVRLPPCRSRRRDHARSARWASGSARRRRPTRSRGRSSAGSTASAGRSQDRPRPRTLLVFGRERLALRGLYASGGIGFLNDMLDVAGGTNVFADVKNQAVQASTEQILARRPDVILETRALNSAWPSGDREAELKVWNARRLDPGRPQPPRALPVRRSNRHPRPAGRRRERP